MTRSYNYLLKLEQRFYPKPWDFDEVPRYLRWDVSKMITRFVFFNSRISAGISGASLEFEDFKSLEIANVIRGREVICSILHQMHSADVNGQESKKANERMSDMDGQVTWEHQNIMKELIKRYLI